MLDTIPENCPLQRKAVKNKLNRGAKFQRVQIMRGDSVTAAFRYEKTKFNNNYTDWRWLKLTRYKTKTGSS